MSGRTSMKTSQVADKTLVESGKRSKARKGTVKVESDKGWLNHPNQNDY
jgi:hypothetical protein